MSLLILSFDRSSDKIGVHLRSQLNASIVSRFPHGASFCPSNELFLPSSNIDFEKILDASLKSDSLSRHDLLGFILLIDFAASNRLHLNDLPEISSLLIYLRSNHPFQPILVFIIHASSNNSLLTSALTCFDLALFLSRIHSSVDGIIFHNIDSHNDSTTYHESIASQLSMIFLPVTSLREIPGAINRSVCVEFLQFIQHLLAHPEMKLLIMIGDNQWKKSSIKHSQAALLIQRGQPSLSGQIDASQYPTLDIWNSLEKNNNRLLILNHHRSVVDLLLKSILQPCRSKLNANRAYLFSLTKKFSRIEIEFELSRALDFSQNLIDNIDF